MWHRRTQGAAATPIANTAAEPEPAADKPRPPDPAGIGGRWEYQTMSNCGTVAGQGWVELIYNFEGKYYFERGEVSWPVEQSTISWSGFAKFDGAARLTAEVENSLGDRVVGVWEVLGDPTEKLVIEWHQTNGCQGTGVATRSDI
jgi:hypothetical protein